MGMGEDDKKRSVSDEGSFLIRAVLKCFKKGRLKIMIFLKLWETSIEENFYLWFYPKNLPTWRKIFWTCQKIAKKNPTSIKKFEPFFETEFNKKKWKIFFPPEYLFWKLNSYFSQSFNFTIFSRSTSIFFFWA